MMKYEDERLRLGDLVYSKSMQFKVVAGNQKGIEPYDSFGLTRARDRPFNLPWRKQNEIIHGRHVALIRSRGFAEMAELGEDYARSVGAADAAIAIASLEMEREQRRRESMAPSVRGILRLLPRILIATFLSLVQFSYISVFVDVSLGLRLSLTATLIGSASAMGCLIRQSYIDGVSQRRSKAVAGALASMIAILTILLVVVFTGPSLPFRIMLAVGSVVDSFLFAALFFPFRVGEGSRSERDGNAWIVARENPYAWEAAKSQRIAVVHRFETMSVFISRAEAINAQMRTREKEYLVELVGDEPYADTDSPIDNPTWLESAYREFHQFSQTGNF